VLSGEFAPEPRGRFERSGGVLRIELDLDGVQTGQPAGVDIDFGDEAARIIEGHSVADLLESSPYRVRPQRLGLVPWYRCLDLGAGQTTARLHGEHGTAGGDSQPHRHLTVLGEIALAHGLTTAEHLGWWELGEQELAFDLERHRYQYAPWRSTVVQVTPLDRKMRAFDGYRVVLRDLADAVDGSWAGSIEHADPEALHEMRVAMRRTRTVLVQAGHVLPPKVIDRALQGFTSLASLTGPARDLDVYLIEWDAYVAPLTRRSVSSLTPVRRQLEARGDDAHLTLAAALRSADALDLMSWWTAWLDKPVGRKSWGKHGEHQLGRVVAKRIERAHDRLIRHGRLIGPETPAEKVHDLRKDAKRLRYLFECFGSLVADDPRRRFVNRLKELQDNLGEHQDAAVHVAQLRAIADSFAPDEVRPATTAAIEELVCALDARSREARLAFHQRFEGFDSKATRQALRAAVAEMT
jgi:CHAD domain-containing protein